MGRPGEETDEADDAIARALSAPSHDADVAARVWEQLWHGGYAVDRVVDAPGRRAFVLRRTAEGADARLTPTERSLVQRAVRGASYKVMAAELGLTIGSVSTQLKRALRKLGIESRVQLVRYFGPCFDRDDVPR